MAEWGQWCRCSGWLVNFDLEVEGEILEGTKTTETSGRSNAKVSVVWVGWCWCRFLGQGERAWNHGHSLSCDSLWIGNSLWIFPIFQQSASRKATWSSTSSHGQCSLLEVYNENGCLNGQWVRIWIGAGWEPYCAEECIDLFPNIILLNNISLQIHSLCESRRKCFGASTVHPDLLSYWWWDTTNILQIVLIYNHDDRLKLINTLCHYHPFCYQCLAGKANPKGDTFSLKISLNTDSIQKYCIYFVLCCLMQIIVHDNPDILTWFQLSHVGSFRVQCFFPSYLFSLDLI